MIRGIQETMNKRFGIGIITFSLCAALLTGCGTKEVVGSEVVTAAPTEVTTVVEDTQVETTAAASEAATEATTVDNSHPGMVRNDMTGLWVDEAVNKRRPIAVMINNIEDAMPQYGIAKADIIYECTVEGGITRLMAIYSDYSDIEKVGSVRSARHYYDRKSIEYDAIYVHYGQSHFAADDFVTYSSVLDDINGLYDGEFFRDNCDGREAPHNAFISSKGIEDCIKRHNFRNEKKADYTPVFQFFDEFTNINGNPAEKVVTAFNSYRRPWFEYDEDDQLYYRFQYGKKQIDNGADCQLAFTNIIIQFCDHSPIEGEEYIDIEWVGSGDGYLVSGGQVVPITWSKGSDLGQTKFYAADGSPLKLNPGKTWITVFPDDNVSGIQFESLKKEEAEEE